MNFVRSSGVVRPIGTAYFKKATDRICPGRWRRSWKMRASIAASAGIARHVVNM
jgi:hypothetical protein